MDGAWTGLIAKRLFHIPFYFRTGYTNTMFYRKMTQRKDFNLWKFSKIEKMLYNKCDLATVSSEHDRQYLCETYGIQKEKISVLVNHVNTEKFYDMKKPPAPTTMPCEVKRTKFRRFSPSTASLISICSRRASP